MICPCCDSELVPDVVHESYDCSGCDYSVDFDIVESQGFSKIYPSLFDDIETLDYSMLG